MNLYIMSRGRAGNVGTLASIPVHWRKNTFLVVPKAEQYDYMTAHPEVAVIAAPEFVTNYSQKFQWLLNGMPQDDLHDFYATNVTYENNTKAVILDDDLVFSRKIDGKLITERNANELDVMFATVEHYLDEYALVGVHPRQMGQNAPTPFVLNSRIICFQGINRAKIGPLKVDQLPILADVILNLSLLERGQANCIITTFFQDHGPCQAPGGCSIYRTAEMQHEAVKYLAARWPDYVSVVERKPKVATWLGDTRFDYRAQWKKLYRDSTAVVDHGKPGDPERSA